MVREAAPGITLVVFFPAVLQTNLGFLKTMTGSLRERPVGLSRRQFETARERGEDFWMPSLEHAAASEGGSIVRIQDPLEGADFLRSITAGSN